jgi:hypothetical protein
MSEESKTPPDEALRLVIEYDALLRKYEGDEEILFDSELVEVDDAYDKMVAAARVALANPLEQVVGSVSIDLMQRIWANLYYSEEEAGSTFQFTLNEVVDWLSARDALPALPDIAVEVSP